MKTLKQLLPFLITILLWRLSLPFWNPAGILAMIPIFYYSFIRKIHWFAPMAVIICFLIDYRGDTLLFWTSVYCLFYAANGFQNFVDITRQKYNGLFVFAGFIGIPVFILTIMDFSFVSFFRNIWLALWMTVLYMTFTKMAKHD